MLNVNKYVQSKLTSLWMLLKDYAISIKEYFQNLLHAPETKISNHVLSDPGDRNHNSNVSLFSSILYALKNNHCQHQLTSINLPCSSKAKSTLCYQYFV